MDCDDDDDVGFHVVRMDRRASTAIDDTAVMLIPDSKHYNNTMNIVILVLLLNTPFYMTT